MLINIGRLLMAGVWLFLLWNLVNPLPTPLRYFLHIALFFMVIMHGLQLLLLKTTQSKEAQVLSGSDQIKIFIFGVFELLAWQKKHYLEKRD